MDKLSCITAFIAIVDNGSIHAAAQQLNQTDAAVSKKLTKLEQYLKTQLIYRNPGNSIPTNIGQTYYQQTKEGLATLYNAENQIQQSNHTPQGKLTILTSRYLFPELIAPRLSAFVAKYPDIQLRFNTAERTANFEHEDVDVLYAIAMAPPNVESLVRVKMDAASTRSIVCATPNYLKKYGIPKKPKDLLKHRYLCHSHQYPYNMITFDNNVELLIPPYMQFDEAATSIIAAKQNLGFICVFSNSRSAKIILSIMNN